MAVTSNVASHSENFLRERAGFGSHGDKGKGEDKGPSRQKRMQTEGCMWLENSALYFSEVLTLILIIII